MSVLRLITLAVASVSCLSATWAQADPCERRTLVSVLGPEGQAVAGLKPENFLAEFRGKKIQVNSASFSDEARRVVVALDTSGSMTSSSLQWQLVLRITRDLIASPHNQTTALLVFGTEVFQQVEGSEGRQAMIGALDSLVGGRKARPKGQHLTAINDAIDRAFRALDGPRLGDAILLITDHGFDHASRARTREIEESMAAAGVRLFVLSFVHADARFEQVEAPEFPRLVRSTGGRLWQVPVKGPHNNYTIGKHNEEQLFREVAAAWYGIRQVYELLVKLPSVVDKPRNWKLRALMPGKLRARDYVLIHQEKLLPCSFLAPSSREALRP